MPPPVALASTSVGHCPASSSECSDCAVQPLFACRPFVLHIGFAAGPCPAGVCLAAGGAGLRSGSFCCDSDDSRLFAGHSEICKLARLGRGGSRSFVARRVCRGRAEDSCF